MGGEEGYRGAGVGRKAKDEGEGRRRRGKREGHGSVEVGEDEERASIAHSRKGQEDEDLL